MFIFVEVEDLCISDLHIHTCRLEVPTGLLTNSLSYSRNSTQAALLFGSVISLVLENVHVSERKGYCYQLQLTYCEYGWL